MKHNNINILLAILMSMISNNVFGYDIAVNSGDSVTLNYNYINNGTELELVGFNFNFYNSNHMADYYGKYNVIIPDSVTYMNRSRPVTSISSRAFCRTGNQLMKTLIIGDNVKTIGAEAFYSCSYLSTLTIGKRVKSIGVNAFTYNDKLKKVIIKDIAAWCHVTFSINEFGNPSNPWAVTNAYLYSDENTIMKELIIPEGVKEINRFCFYKCRGPVSITIPKSMKHIYSWAFYGFSLKSVNITDIPCWCNINFESYPNAPDLYLNGERVINLTIPDGVKKIGARCFAGFSSLSSVNIPNSVTMIGEFAFYDCSGIESIIIPNSTKSIGNSAFEGCSKLTSVIIGNNVKSIENSTFKNCSGLKYIDIPNCVTNIGERAFYGCNGLTSVVIPLSVTSIGQYAFSDCNSLYIIVSLIENPFALTKSQFTNDHYKNTSLYVPEGTKDKYKSTEGWKQFIWMKEGIPTGIQEEKVTNDDEKTWYSLDGMKLESAKKGINIIRHTNGKTSKVLIK
ncbi:MAG: leucine-rich repeat domain-containing protein [Prevotella sp.]|nr:leucine-rich repeat domain-containing protein [Prevotella sp.]